MSLRVWLPLTKDLRNQGLDDVTVTTANTNVFQNEGKISGKSLDVSGHYAFRVPSLVKKRVFSCSFWYKPVADSSLSDNWRRIIVFDTYTSDGSTTGAIFRFESSYGYQSSSTTYCISIHNNVGAPIASIGTGLGETDGWNKWQHIAITADGTTLKCYRNGVQVASGNMGNGGMLQGTVHIGYSGNRPIGRLNDFRLYDHCLSPMEVKELAKGLVLHYPLNRQGWGQENLLRGTYDWTRWTISSYASTSNDVAILTGTTANWFASIHSAHLNKSLLDGTTTYTWSFEYNSTVTWACNPVIGGTATDVDTTTASRTKYVYWQNVVSLPSTDGKWKKYVLTPRTIAESQMTSGSGDVNSWFLQIYNRTNDAVVQIRHIKLEKGSVATPWCPNSSDALADILGLNSTTEYDCSGFCNNGTRVGTFEWTSDTSKYSVSTKFSGSNYIKTLPGEFTWSNYDNLTIAVWMKPAATPGSWTGSVGIASDVSSYTSKAVAISNYGGKFSIHIPNGSAWGTTQSTYTIPLNIWHHCVATISGTTVKMYVDGVLNKTFTADFGTATNHANPQIEVGVDLPGSDEIYNGYYSDVRIYATALSAEDVKSLYQNSAYIDSSGNVYGAVHSEV